MHRNIIYKAIKVILIHFEEYGEAQEHKDK